LCELVVPVFGTLDSDQVLEVVVNASVLTWVRRFLAEELVTAQAHVHDQAQCVNVTFVSVKCVFLLFEADLAFR